LFVGFWLNVDGVEDEEDEADDEDDEDEEYEDGEQVEPIGFKFNDELTKFDGTSHLSKKIYIIK
jgi:hypothetical protein